MREADAMIDQVIVVLHKLCEVYDKLYSLSLKKQEYIVKNDAEGVNEIVKEEWDLLNDVSDLENERSVAVAKCFPPDSRQEATVQNLVSIATPSQKQELEQVSDRLKDILDKLKKTNAENRSLIELHLEYVDYMVNTVLKEPQLSNIYGNSGTVEDGTALNKGIIDNEA